MKIIEGMVPASEYIGEVVIPHISPGRRFWYPLLDRHKERISVDKSLVGKDVLVNKFIRRTGYLFQHNDIYLNHLRETVYQVLKADLINQGVNIEMEPAALAGRLEKAFGYGVFTRALYKARKLWISEVYKPEQFAPYKHLRAFWYVSVQDVNPRAETWLNIKEIKRHWVGIQYPASFYGYSGPDGSVYDYEPGGLDNALFQEVYLASSWRDSNNHHPAPASNYEEYYDGMVEIHPLDILEVA